MQQQRGRVINRNSFCLVEKKSKHRGRNTLVMLSPLNAWRKIVLSLVTYRQVIKEIVTAFASRG